MRITLNGLRRFDRYLIFVILYVGAMALTDAPSEMIDGLGPWALLVFWMFERRYDRKCRLRHR